MFKVFLKDITMVKIDACEKVCTALDRMISTLIPLCLISQPHFLQVVFLRHWIPDHVKLISRDCPILGRPEGLNTDSSIVGLQGTLRSTQ